MKVTVVGAGKYGSTTVQRIAEKDVADEIVMTDIVEGLPQGLALDMNQSRPLEGFETRVVGSNGYEESAGSDVCVITAGLPRKPGMSRMDLLETNARIVGDVTRKFVEGSPEAVIVVVSNPLDEMTALAAEVSGFPRERVMGQAGMLDTARFKHFVAEAVLSDSGALMPVCAWVTGQYGIDGVYLGVPARLGRGGVREVVELPLTEAELANLREAAEAVRAKQADAIKLV